MPNQAGGTQMVRVSATRYLLETQITNSNNTAVQIPKKAHTIKIAEAGEETTTATCNVIDWLLHSLLFCLPLE